MGAITFLRGGVFVFSAQLKSEIDPTTLQLTPESCRRLMTSRTVAIYASAPTFTHGVVDPIEQLGALAHSKGVGLHGNRFMSGLIVDC